MIETVLLVDDEPHILRAAAFKLERCGLQTVTAENGEDAWSEIVRQRPSLVVTDLQMPLLSGLDLIERIRACPETVDLPVIMLSAKGFDPIPADAAGRLDVFDVMSKPFSPQKLFERVRAALDAQLESSPTSEDTVQ